MKKEFEIIKAYAVINYKDTIQAIFIDRETCVNYCKQYNFKWILTKIYRKIS